jgi:hypothetical protein
MCELNYASLRSNVLPSSSWSKSETLRQELSKGYLCLVCSEYSLNLTIEALRPSVTSVKFYQSTRNDTAENVTRIYL